MASDTGISRVRSVAVDGDDVTASVVLVGDDLPFIRTIRAYVVQDPSLRIVFAPRSPGKMSLMMQAINGVSAWYEEPIAPTKKDTTLRNRATKEQWKRDQRKHNRRK